MNNFFDYIFIRTYKFYDSFENQPSEFAAKIILTLIQLFIVLDLLGFATYLITIRGIHLKIVIVPLLVLVFLRIDRRYSNRELFNSLKVKWSKETRNIKIVKGYAIFLLIITVMVTAVAFTNYAK